ncbi:hypothetical protein SEA_KYKAR_68 [Mycobacterium phage Kykar]|nr:hypothetical protein SEA_KYKAR_68 [Mycobacterium phage Kykar]
MTSNEELIREVLAKALPGGLSHLAIMDATTDLLKRFDITEKPEPRDPIGTVRATLLLSSLAAVYVKIDDETWLTLYSNGDADELSDHKGPWGNVEVFRPQSSWEKHDITEKPEPEAPIGTVRVRRGDYEPEDASIYIKVGAYRWVGVYTGEAYSKGFYVNDHLPGGEWGDTEVFRP